MWQERRPTHVAAIKGIRRRVDSYVAPYAELAQDTFRGVFVVPSRDSTLLCSLSFFLSCLRWRAFVHIHLLLFDGRFSFFLSRVRAVYLFV